MRKLPNQFNYSDQAHEFRNEKMKPNVLQNKILSSSSERFENREKSIKTKQYSRLFSLMVQ